MRLSQEYPNYNGWPVHPLELDLPQSDLSPDRQHNFNNHHLLWTARDFGRHAISLACRNLDSNQIVLPRDIHQVIHDRYEPAPMPSLVDMMDRLEEAYMKRELLRYGTALNPSYRIIDIGLWRNFNTEYNKLDNDRAKTIIT